MRHYDFPPAYYEHHFTTTRRDTGWRRHTRSRLLARRGRAGGRPSELPSAVTGEEYLMNYLDKRCETEEQLADLYSEAMLLTMAMGFTLKD